MGWQLWHALKRKYTALLFSAQKSEWSISNAFILSATFTSYAYSVKIFPLEFLCSLPCFLCCPLPLQSVRDLCPSLGLFSGSSLWSQAPGMITAGRQMLVLQNGKIVTRPPPPRRPLCVQVRKQTQTNLEISTENTWWKFCQEKALLLLTDFSPQDSHSQVHPLWRKVLY